jgi:glycosyltransferase involved in cell wall biosynthesis
MSVTVIIPAYNAGQFVEESLQSVLVQDWPADEIIVVNDGSTDRDYGELAALAPNIRVVNQANRGVSAARNRGCALATSDYVAILDADDVWLPMKLRSQMQHLADHPATDAVFCLGMYWRPKDAGNRWVRPDLALIASAVDFDITQLRYADFLLNIPVASSTMVIKRSVWRAIGGFNEGMKYAEDQDFNLRLSRSYRVDLVKQIGMLYRQHATSATARIQDQNHWADVTSRAIEAMGLSDASGMRVDVSRLRRRLAQLHFFHGYDHFWRGQLSVARREFRRAFLKNPVDPKTLAYLFVSAIPGLPSVVKQRRPKGRFVRPTGDSGRRRSTSRRGILDDVTTRSGAAPR